MAEDLFDETYYPEDAVDDMMDEAEDAVEAAEDAAEAAEDAADDSQVSRIIAVDIRETSTSIELMTVIWGLLLQVGPGIVGAGAAVALASRLTGGAPEGQKKEDESVWVSSVKF